MKPVKRLARARARAKTMRLMRFNRCPFYQSRAAGYGAAKHERRRP